jgi:hypothetical protein
MAQHNRLHNVWYTDRKADRTMRKMSMRKLIPSLQPRVQSAVRLYRVCDWPQPPLQNRQPLRIKAGELYDNHHEP